MSGLSRLTDGVYVDGVAAGHPKTGAPPQWRALAGPVAFYVLIVALFMIGFHFASGLDYVGRDNDDTMRLMEVRDLLAGQGWFDTHQYRLGLEGGTLMHWSRLIDLPIANLIAFFSLFFAQQTAEAIALTVWPTLTLVPLFFGMALASRRLGGPVAVHMGLILTALYVIALNRFQPGSIDHHNVQLGTIALLAGLLIGPDTRSWAFAGALCAFAIAIGAETTPHIAVVCLVVALSWAWHGEERAQAVRAFSLAMAMALTVFFYLAVPPARYNVVVCDQISAGFYVLGVAGASGLFLAAATVSRYGPAARFAALGFVGAVVGAMAIKIAPECLQSPLAGLDPMLKELWLNNVTEAQTVIAQLRAEPFTSGGFYAVPPIALAVCVWRIVRNERREQHLVFAALIAIAYAIALVQVRGAIFANMLAFVPMAALVADLRSRSHAEPKNRAVAAKFILTAVLSVPAVWVLSGASLAIALDMQSESDKAAADSDPDAPTCTTPSVLAPLAQEPAGVVSAVSNIGDDILRFSPHRVLAAPYHRNQGGMLTALYIGLSNERDAEAFLRGAGVTLLAYCPGDPETGHLIDRAPDGLYALLGKGDVPAYLDPVAATMDSSLRLYRVKPEAN